MDDYDISTLQASAEAARAAFAALHDDINDLDEAARGESGTYDFTGLTSATMEATGAILAKVAGTLEFMTKKLQTLSAVYTGMLTAIQPETPEEETEPEG